ncbi:helix-turn-helix transcriptional regulator [Luteolibacter yonseiensis]
MDELTRDHGPQPLDGLMVRWNLTNHELVEVSEEQLNHKQVQKARKGRQLTLHLMQKLTRALNETVMMKLPKEDREKFVPYLHKHLHSYFLQFSLHCFRKDRDAWMTSSSALADRIRAARKSLGLTQKEMAKRLGVTEGTFFTWEAGGHEPSGTMIRKLSEFLRIEIGQPRNA